MFFQASLVTDENRNMWQCTGLCRLAAMLPVPGDGIYYRRAITTTTATPAPYLHPQLEPLNRLPRYCQPLHTTSRVETETRRAHA